MTARDRLLAILRRGGWHRGVDLAEQGAMSEGHARRLLRDLVAGGTVERVGRTCDSAWAMAGESDPPAPRRMVMRTCRHASEDRAERWLAEQHEPVTPQQAAAALGWSVRYARRLLERVGLRVEYRPALYVGR